MQQKDSDRARHVQLAVRAWEASQPKSDSYYEVWFLYLRAALDDPDSEIQSDLKKSFQTTYAQWGDVRKKLFDDWIAGMGEHLVVSCARILGSGEKAKEDELTVAIRLTRNEDDTVKEVAARVRLALHLKRVAGLYHPKKAEHKPKLYARLSALIVHQADAAVKAKGLKGAERRQFIREYYKQGPPGRL